jgi:peptidoglycan/LPS O-acetylase OafA/YrhL
MPFTLGRRPALDGLRGLSVIAVMAIHATAAAKGGWIGVQVFFVISGFVITLVILEEVRSTNAFSFRNFYARRGLRLLPALFAMLVFVGVYSALFPHRVTPHDAGQAGLATVFYVANWMFAIKGSHPFLLVHTWSLAVEEQFYLLWPPLLIALVFRRAGMRAVLIAAVAGATASAVWRYVLITHHSSIDRVYLGTDTRVDAMLIGCALAVLFHAGWMPTGARFVAWVRVAAAASAVVLVTTVVTVARPRPVLYEGGLTLLALCAASIIALIVLSPDGLASRALAWRPLERLGQISYGLYLWHLPIFVITRWAIPTVPNLVAVPIMVTLSIGVAVASHQFVEQPFLRAKERFRSVPIPVLVAA